MLEDVNLYLFKINIFNLSNSESFMNGLKIVTNLKSLNLNEEVDEGLAPYSMMLDYLNLEQKLYTVLLSLITESHDQLVSSKVDTFCSTLMNDKLFKLTDTPMSLELMWSAMVNFLIKQWNIKVKRMILNHFKVKESIVHLTDTEKTIIKMLGRYAQNLNPYVMLMGKMTFINDNFILNQRTTTTYDFSTFELSFSRLRIRGDNTAVAEMIKDNFSYKLTLNDDVRLYNNVGDVQSVTSQLSKFTKTKPTLDAAFTRPLFGFKSEITTFPMFLVFRLDRMMTVNCVNGCKVTIRSDKDFSFPEFITGEDFNIFDSQLSYCLLSAETCKGSVFFRSDGEWIKRKSYILMNISEKCFEECFTNEGAEVLIYVRNIF